MRGIGGIALISLIVIVIYPAALLPVLLICAVLSVGNKHYCNKR
jgi:hypothetical protein